MNFNTDFGVFLMKLLDKYESSPKVRHLIWAILATVVLYGLPELILAIKS